jgi:glycosyltransferase involved in cell wall biosynthesis
MGRRVLFVSKPIAPPFHDGTKCLVRDVAFELTQVLPIVMSTAGAPSIESAVGRSAMSPIEEAHVYSDAGAFSPSFAANLRAAAWLFTRARADLWHFVFAPNARTSRVGRILARSRRVPVVQTVASPPKSFERPGRLLFGDVVVAQSQWTLDRLRSGLTRERGSVPRGTRLEVIPPPLGALSPRSPAALAAARAELDIAPEAPILVYPGDLETSSGARAVAELVAPLAREVSGLVVVFAYRAKSPRAFEVARSIAGSLDPRQVRVKGDVGDVLALIQTSSAVLFPVDDLWGKVDLPIVLLEAMALGVPVILYDWGPLSELEGALRVPTGDNRELLSATLAVLRDAGLRGRVVAEQREAVARRHDAKLTARAYERLYLELLREPP